MHSRETGGERFSAKPTTRPMGQRVRLGRDMLRLIVFAILSAALAYVSRASLKAPRSHGFFRFFAWECILALFFLNFTNFQQWFGNPFSVRQFISWFLLISCIVPGVYGAQLLRTCGRQDDRRPLMSPCSDSRRQPNW